MHNHVVIGSCLGGEQMRWASVKLFGCFIGDPGRQHIGGVAAKG